MISACTMNQWCQRAVGRQVPGVERHESRWQQYGRSRHLPGWSSPRSNKNEQNSHVPDQLQEHRLTSHYRTDRRRLTALAAQPTAGWLGNWGYSSSSVALGAIRRHGILGSNPAARPEEGVLKWVAVEPGGRVTRWLAPTNPGTESWVCTQLPAA